MDPSEAAVGASFGLAAASVNALAGFSDFSWPESADVDLLIVVAAESAGRRSR